MTGNQLKAEIKKLGITQEKAADMLNVSRATLNNWCKQAELPPLIVKNVNTILNINIDDNYNGDLLSVVKSQQETINRQSKIIETLTSKID